MSTFTGTASLDEAEAQQPHMSRLYAAAALIIVILALWSPVAGSAGAEKLVVEQKGAGKSTAPDAPNCDPDWQVVASPNKAVSYRTYLRATDGEAPYDMWAVGYADTGGVSQAIIEHWDGTSWSLAYSPQGYVSSALYGVTALATNDVWAVGYSRTTAAGVAERTFILHWDGSAWTNVASPNIGNGGNFLRSVHSIYANNVWAVGYYASGSTFWTLTLRWNGSYWSTVASPNMGTMSKLEGVAVASNSHIWAVGRYVSNGYSYALTMKWNGSTWITINYTDSDANNAYLYGITALSPVDIWAVGYHHGQGWGASITTFMIHWNGTQWTRSGYTAETNPGDINTLYSVRATSATSVWTVGYYLSSGVLSTLVLKWDGSAWHKIASPNAAGNNVFYGVGSSGLSNVWAVGEHGTSDGVIEKWNGTQWSLYAGPAVNVSGSYLTAVDSISSSDAWAAGYSRTGMTNTLLLEHWNGSAWSVAPAPAPPGTSSLTGVAQIASNDAWAVGTNGTGSTDNPLTMHWDGSAWSLISSPGTGQKTNRLTGIYALNSSNVWAVGYYNDDATLLQRTLVLYWNGSAWSIVPSPNVGTGSNSLSAVAGTSANDVWAAGSYFAGSTVKTLVMHWNGSAWTVVTSPNIGSSNASNYLHSVTALSPTDAWAVGSYATSVGFNTVSMHWDGVAWSIVASPNTTSPVNYLISVDKVSATDVWAVGTSKEGFVQHTLVEHWDGAAWSIVTSPDVGQKSNYTVGVTVASPADVYAVGSYDTTVSSQTLVERFNPCN